MTQIGLCLWKCVILVGGRRWSRRMQANSLSLEVRQVVGSVNCCSGEDLLALSGRLLLVKMVPSLVLLHFPRFAY